MNRWKMHRLGFLNFWLYDCEEFWIRDGHFLLRGNNASGGTEKWSTTSWGMGNGKNPPGTSI